MPTLNELLSQGPAHAWLFAPSAIVLGALHGLEPGHSKTMMAAFIVAIRGTLTQAVLLGLAAALSHTAVVWVVALIGLHYGATFNAGSSEPYFQIASAAAIIAIAGWMLWRSWHDLAAERAHDHAHDHSNDHHDHPHEPAGYQDAHERAHSRALTRRFEGRTVTTREIVLFGLTGGLIPCPAAITVLLVCLQLKQVSLGVALVACFSLGLAITMVAVGAIAALGVQHASKRWTGFGTFARYAPFVSSALIIVMGLYLGLLGWSKLAAA